MMVLTEKWKYLKIVLPGNDKPLIDDFLSPYHPIPSSLHSISMEMANFSMDDTTIAKFEDKDLTP
jgi:hypothetical protein